MDRTGMGLDSSGERMGQAHLVGLDGSGMPGLARLLVRRGYVVTGSVRTPGPATDRLRKLGVRVDAGHSPGSIARSARLLIYSPEVPKEHPDRLSAASQGIEQRSSPTVLADLLRRKSGIAAIGGRKAGIAAAMVGWTLTHAGLDPAVLCGSDAPELEPSSAIGHGFGDHLIFEGDDGPGGLEVACPGITILHDDSDSATRSVTLRRWAESAPAGGFVLGFADHRDEVEPCPASRGEVERFSMSPGHAWWGADLRQDRGLYRFRAFHNGRFAVEIRLQVPGRHLVLGALATVAVGLRVGLSCRAIKEALEEYRGISRGFESRGSFRGVTLIDDEADGPRGVGDALAVAREAFGPRRICVAYRAAMSEPTWPDPAEFAQADRIWIIAEPGDARSGTFAAGLIASGARVGQVSGLEGAIEELDRHLEPGDVLVTLGAGDVGTIADAFLRRLSSHRHA